jgi:hypothetical protein
MTHQEAVDTLAVERYLLDEMSDDQRQTFEAHYFECEMCADDLRVATAMMQGAKEGFAGASARKTVWYRSAALPWAVAATLAVLAGYESLWVAPSLRRRAPPLALTPLTLRPQSRGAEAVIPVDVHGGPITLAIEINEPPQAGEVTYELNSTDGRHIVSGRAPAPTPGSPLLLLMPSWTLVGPMHYILSVHDAAGTGRLLGEYRLTVPAQ